MKCLAGQTITALLAGAFFLAGVIGCDANQAVPLQYGVNYVTCLVTEPTTGNFIDNPLFLNPAEWASSDVFDPKIVLVVLNSSGPESAYIYFDGIDISVGLPAGWYDNDNIFAGPIPLHSVSWPQYGGMKVATNAPGTIHLGGDLPASATDIDMQICGPPKIGANCEQQFTVAYRNTTSGSLSNVTIKVDGIPPGVTCSYPGASAVTPQISGGEAFSFTIPNLASSPNSYSYFGFTMKVTNSSALPPIFNLDVSSTPYSSNAPTKSIESVASYDPNDKFGISGVGANHYITGTELLPYGIHFENNPSATAPAQQVFVTDQLDPGKVDLNTFNLGPITFGTHTITPPLGVHTFTIDVPFDVDGNSSTTADDILVRVTANLDSNGLFTCNYLSIDPLTGLLPVNPTRGFLPPNVTQPGGEGSVSFTIRAKPGLADGTLISNGATIVFDVNAPILTPVWDNTIDRSKPVSAVAALPAVSIGSHFNVTWGGTDGGSGIATYDIWVSDNGGAATLWLTGTNTAAGLYPGANGHTYQFYSVARDAVGNIEDAPASPDTSTTVDTSIPYDNWTAQFSGFALTDPDADLDGDGMTNRQEYAFGLDPTHAASGSPITVMLDKTLGTFSYTRRDPALTGLTYTVWTSTDLRAWTESTGAGQAVTGTSGNVQTIEVALGNAPLVAPALFVRVKAE